MLTLTLAAAAADTGFVTKTFTNADKTESKYVVFVPKAYDGTKEFPVILFLHGAGETKGGSKMPVEQGLGTYIKKHAETFEYITIIPQAETRGWGADGPNGKRAMAMLAAVQKEFKTDEKRVILTGLSMGGFGSWSLAAAHPEKWAAVVPVCGGGNLKDAEKMKDLPIWCFHGDADTAVKVDLSRTMIKAIEAAGGKPKYTEYAKVGHNSWDAAYATPELWEWLAKQAKK